MRPDEFERDSNTIIEGLLDPETPYNQHFYKIASDILQVSLEVIYHTLPKEAFHLERTKLSYTLKRIPTSYSRKVVTVENRDANPSQAMIS